MNFVSILMAASVITGISESDVILINETGLPIARIVLDGRTFDAGGGTLPANDKVLITVADGKHHLKLVFRGGADIDWPDINFRGVHEIVFQRSKNRIQAHID